MENIREITKKLKAEGYNVSDFTEFSENLNELFNHCGNGRATEIMTASPNTTRTAENST